VPQRAAARSRTRPSRRRGPPRTGRPIMPPSPVAVSAIGAVDLEVMAGRCTGMRCHQDRPIRGIRDRGLSCPPAAQPSPVATTRAPGDLADGRPPSRSVARHPGSSTITGTIRRWRISGRSVTPESAACPAFDAYQIGDKELCRPASESRAATAAGPQPVREIGLMGQLPVTG
jgi:hypothetical protein